MERDEEMATRHEEDNVVPFRERAPDYLDEERAALIPDDSPPSLETAEVGSELGFNILDWSTDRYAGEAPPIEWMCEGTIPQAVPALLASMGGVGKSFIAIDIALEIAAAVLDGEPRRVLGGNVLAKGSVVVLNAEDNQPSVHRRLARIDTGDRREQARGRAFIVPLPEVGGPMPLIAGGPGDFMKTAKFDALVKQLEQIPNLRLVIIDPLQAFVTADITKDPAAGQFMWSAFAEICAKTGATILCCHHMRKDGSSHITTADEAREAIRGSTALVDGARATYALWNTADEEAERICVAANVEFRRKRVVHGAVVKANDEHDLEIHTYIRSESGLLVDATEIGRVAAPAKGGLTDAQARQALREIDARWVQGRPFSAAANSPDRYIGNWLQYQFRISKQHVRTQISAWFASEILCVEEYNSHTKQMGIRVLKWPN
jgi:hypothetical protein